MNIETSAIVAIIQQEPRAERLRLAISRGALRVTSAASVLEATMVLESRRASAAVRDLDSFLSALSVTVIPFDLDQLVWARFAFRTYGKGRHPAGLNFGDCFSYALSKVTGQPLLFVGTDFSRTDVEAVAW